MTADTMEHKEHTINNGTASPGLGSSVGSWVRRRGRNVCTKKTLNKRLPITAWLPKYTLDTLLKDFIAGITVGLTAIPQGIAYAVVAGLPPQYGLYSSFMGCFVYMFLGGCKDVTIGPTAIMALMVQQYVNENGPDFAVLSTFMAGIFIFILGILHLGFLVEFISMPVTAGFTCAAAITIASSQLKSLFGLSGKGNEFLESWINLVEHIQETRLWDTILGVSTIILLLIFRKLTCLKGKLAGVGKALSLGRNALVVIGGALLAWALSANGMEPFKLTGTVEEGFPPFKPPPFSTIHNNKTIEFPEMAKILGGSLAAIPLVAVLESVAIAKAFAKGRALDATQEMLALGMCNIVGSFFSSMPTTGSFTRTAVNHASGVVTPLGGIFTGALILLALGLLTSTFYYIPKATLAGVIICAMIFMLEIDNVKLLWRTKKMDLIPFVVTLIACLFLGLEYGIIVGIACNLLFILYNTARPKIIVSQTKVNNHDVVLVTPDQSLVFSSADYVRSCVLRSGDTEQDVIIVVDGKHIHDIDATVARNIKVLTEDIRLRNQEIIFWNWTAGPAGVLCRLDPKLSDHFITASTVEEAVALTQQVQPVIAR